jgi:hypothetical protein
MWGSNATLVFPINGSAVDVPDIQLIDAPMPEPCVASIFFQAEVLAPPTLTYAISYLTLTMQIGSGRVTVQRQETWNGTPRVGVPIVFTIPFIPVTSFLATVRGGGNSFASEELKVLCTAQVAPISRYPVTNSLSFGMAKPGEADGADEELFEDLEAHSPDEADVMRAAQDAGHHPESALVRPEPRGISHDQMPPRVSRVVRSLEKRLHRPPRMSDLPPWARRELTKHLRSGQ